MYDNSFHSQKNTMLTSIPNLLIFSYATILSFWVLLRKIGSLLSFCSELESMFIVEIIFGAVTTAIFMLYKIAWVIALTIKVAVFFGLKSITSFSLLQTKENSSGVGVCNTPLQ